MTLLAPSPAVSPVAKFDPLKVRADFPILQTSVHGKPLVYLDNGATTQKPRAVIDAIGNYYASQNANIHRGVYHLSIVATELYDAARKKVAAFINAPDPHEVILTRGTTEGINLVAGSWGRTFLRPGDEVIVSEMEHHSNIVPWQMACEATGAKLRVIPVTDAGELDLDAYAELLSERTKFVSVTHLSNALGTINDLRRIVRMAHAVGAKVLADGAQWVAHYPTDVQDLGVDFYAFSGHKLFGPTGIGALWGRRELLEAMPPYQGGGDMIEMVSFERTTYAPIPSKFEAGTPNIAGAVGLGAAIDYVTSIGFNAFADHEHELLAYAGERLAQIGGLRLIGTARERGTVFSFVVENPPISPLDLGTRLDAEGIAVRTGHHCCQPLMGRFGISATTRASFAMYNTKGDVDALVRGLRKIIAAEAARSKQSAHGEDPPVPPPPPRIAGEVAAAGAIEFPTAAYPSLEAAADDLAETFEFLGDRDARNEYIMGLGEKLPPMPDALKTDVTRVHGCMSTVHLFGRRHPGSVDALDFVADSDAHIVRGLIAILQKLFAGQSAKAILAFDVEAFFTRIGLEQFVSSQRRNGLAGMVKRIRDIAVRLAQQQQV